MQHTIVAKSGNYTLDLRIEDILEAREAMLVSRSFSYIALDLIPVATNEYGDMFTCEVCVRRSHILVDIYNVGVFVVLFEVLDL